MTEQERARAMDEIEQVARAISDARLWAGAWDKMGEPERNQFRQMAEGVLASDWLRARDARMMQAGMLKATGGGNPLPADDEICTGCYGTGYDGNREDRCHCQPPLAKAADERQAAIVAWLKNATVMRDEQGRRMTVFDLRADPTVIDAIESGEWRR